MVLLDDDLKKIFEEMKGAEIFLKFILEIKDIDPEFLNKFCSNILDLITQESNTYKIVEHSVIEKNENLVPKFKTE